MDYEELLRLSHDHINGYIRVADQKASILLSGQIAFLAIFADQFSESFSTLSTVPAILVAATILAAMAAILFSILTVIPREESDGKEGYIYWGNILEHDDQQEFVSKIKNLTEEDVDESLAKEVYSVSKIADEKYTNLKISIVITVVFLLSAITSIAII